MKLKPLILSILTGCLLFSVGSVKAADELKIYGPAKSDPGDLVILDASDSKIFDAAPQSYIWKLTNSTKTFMPMEGGSKVVFSSGTPGEYRFLLIGVSARMHDPDGEAGPEPPKLQTVVLDKEVTVTVGNQPDPSPGPGPQPGPGPSEKLNVVVIRDYQVILPQKQISAFTGEAASTYLQSVAPITPTSGFRFLDYRTPTAGEAPFIQKALAMPRDSLPWIVVTGPKGSYSGPAPKDLDELKTLVGRYQ